MAIPRALRFTDASASTYVQCGAQSDTAALASETRVALLTLSGAPSGNNVILSQGGGGPSNWLFTSTGALSYTRDYSTTDANVAAPNSAVNVTYGQPVCVAVVLDAGVPRLYGGTLNIPIAEATSYNAQTTAVGSVVDKSANQVQMGGFQGFGQGLNGYIWYAAWFGRALTLAELRQIQYNPEQWEKAALHCWYPGADGTQFVRDVGGGRTKAHGIITGAVTAAESLPLIAIPDKAHVAKYKRAIFTPAGGFFARHYYDSLLVKGHV